MREMSIIRILGYRFIQGFEKMHEVWKGMSRGVNSGVRV